MWKKVLACCVFLGTAAVAQSTLLVPSQYPTIQAGITAAQNGDTILVGPGTYFESINFLGKAIVVRSANGAASTVIDGSALASVVTIINGEPAAATLRGFTITHGRAHEGGGIYISDSSPTIIENVVTSNQGINAGAGICARFSASLISRNVITNNVQIFGKSGQGGGGICVAGVGGAVIEDNVIQNNFWGSEGGGISVKHPATIRRNKILFNSTGGSGGGLVLGNSGGGPVEDNLIVGNSAFRGGGIYRESDNVVGIKRNTIALNTATLGSGIFIAGPTGANAHLDGNIIVGSPGQAAVQCGFLYSGPTPTFTYNDVWTAGAPAYTGECPSPTGSVGNISTDSMFVNPALGDYSLSPASPCIDMGNPAFNTLATDLVQTPRVLDGNLDGALRVDYGALEFTNVRLAASGAFQPGGTIALTVTGSPGLRVFFVFGSIPGSAQCPLFGAVYFSLTSYGAVDAMAVTPLSQMIRIPASAVLPPMLILQALGVVPAGGAGNLSNPVVFTLAP